MLTLSSIANIHGLDNRGRVPLRVLAGLRAMAVITNWRKGPDFFSLSERKAAVRVVSHMPAGIDWCRITLVSTPDPRCARQAGFTHHERWLEDGGAVDRNRAVTCLEDAFANQPAGQPLDLHVALARLYLARLGDPATAARS
jgi:hypothetical protein